MFGSACIRCSFQGGKRLTVLLLQPDRGVRTK